MTTSPPMERLWIATAGRRPREGHVLPTSILGGPGPLARLPLLSPKDRPKWATRSGWATANATASGPDADAMVNDEGQRLWLLQHTATQWGLDAFDPQGLAIQSILPQFFGDAGQPDAIAAVRVWTALVGSEALGHLEVPVSVIFGETDRYLNPSLAVEIAGLFKDPSFHLVQNASYWPQYDQPEVVADLLKVARTTR
jgi:pimeloyl-ACP methyl ester carboxylesterase